MRNCFLEEKHKKYIYICIHKDVIYRQRNIYVFLYIYLIFKYECVKRRCVAAPSRRITSGDNPHVKPVLNSVSFLLMSVLGSCHVSEDAGKQIIIHTNNLAYSCANKLPSPVSERLQGCMWEVPLTIARLDLFRAKKERENISGSRMCKLGLYIKILYEADLFFSISDFCFWALGAEGAAFKRLFSQPRKEPTGRFNQISCKARY